MLISPPFLPHRTPDQQDEAYVDQAMPGGAPGAGAYPLSYNLGWHGGVHVIAPTDGVTALPVCAIADGTVVYVRPPTPPNADPTHPLNYNGGWTSDGVVVLRHETAIGDGATAQATFFSIYVHLSSVDSSVVVDRPVFRKYVIGEAGQIYGSQTRAIHLETVCDDVNMQRLVGRAAGGVDVSTNGRTDAIYGEVYVRLPSGTPLFAQAPAAGQTQPPAGTAAVHTTTEEMFVGLRYRGGDLTVATYGADGSIMAAAIVEDDAEHRIYARTRELANVFPAGHRPVRSAVYELLRFGRVISATETLTPADMPLWQQIAYPAGRAFANLNAAGTSKYSDADFPQWRCWSLIDDSADHDSRCDSPTIRRWLDLSGDGQVPPAEASGQLADPTLLPRLERVVCKFSTEWEAATIDTRWGWLMQVTVENPSPMSEADFAGFRRHLKALCFWQQANLQIGGTLLPTLHWRFHPREFIKWFRRCDWFSQRELARCIPRTVGTSNLSWATATQRAGTHLAALNMLVRKYIGPDRQRHVHVLAQIYIETGILWTPIEGGLGQSHDYGPFYGRGLMQLTWPVNYDRYGDFKGLRDQTGTPHYVDARITPTSVHLWEQGGQARVWAPRYDPDVIGSQGVHTGESGGYYWVSKTFRGTSNINRVCDLGLGGNHVGFASWLVNGGGNGYRERQQYARYLRNVLLDEPPLTATETWNYPPLGPALTGGFPPGNPTETQSVQVNHARQSP